MVNKLIHSSKTLACTAYGQKKLKDRTRIRVYAVYGFYSLLKSQPSFLIGGEH